MQFRNCPICTARPSDSGLIGPLNANHEKQEGRRFSLVACACEDLIYISPAPDDADIRAMYAESPQFDQAGYRGDFFASADKFYSGRLRALLREMKHPVSRPLRLLEIGAGLSWMCRVAKQLNPANVTVAQDISSEVAAECTWVDHYYVASDLMQCSDIDAQAPYDVISLTHVIEHLIDPVGALKVLRRVIAPGGTVFITAPHRPPGWKSGEGIDAWQSWSYNHVPAHIQYFSRPSLERAAREAGFDLGFWVTGEEDQAFEAWLRPAAPAATVSMVRPTVREEVARYRQEFVHAAPFPHVAIDDFFEPAKAEKVLADFPPFDPANATNEFGKVGRKAVVTDIRGISPFYAEVHDYLASKGFLDLVSQITGIPDLVYDEQMFGAGTHENLEGQELDTHVDFNYIESSKLHRRLNLLLYLNKEWEEEWGGSIELHSNPRRPREDRITVIRPLFNRCVIFETSERSWHGFRRIQLPEGRKHLSRKLLSIYLYTRERPAAETAPPHSTFYIQKPLPARYTAGYTLRDEDALELEQFIEGRDGWIEHYQNKELTDSARIQQLAGAIESLGPGPQAPLSANARQQGRARGLWDDGWIGSPFEVTMELLEAADSLVLRGETSPNCVGEQELWVSVDGGQAVRHLLQPGEFALPIRAPKDAGDTLKLSITSAATYCAARAGTGSDRRELLLLLDEMKFLRDSDPAEPAPLPPRQVPVTGCAHQEGRARGISPDHWLVSPFEAGMRLDETIGSIVIEGYLPEAPPPEMELTIRLNGAAVLRQKPTQGLFSLKLVTHVFAGELVKVGIASNMPCQVPGGIDLRERMIVLRELRAEPEGAGAASASSARSTWPRRLGRFVKHRIGRAR